MVTWRAATCYDWTTSYSCALIGSKCHVTHICALVGSFRARSSATVLEIQMTAFYERTLVREPGSGFLDSARALSVILLKNDSYSSLAISWWWVIGGSDITGIGKPTRYRSYIWSGAGRPPTDNRFSALGTRSIAREKNWFCSIVTRILFICNNPRYWPFVRLRSDDLLNR